MKNWAKSFEFHPQNVYAPTSSEEIQSLVKDHIQKKKSIRMRGSAHSWTGLIATNESFLHLDQMQGLIEAYPEKNMVKAYAGTKLYRFGEEAFTHGMTLPNQGDVNHQSLAGALSTGTHGTGLTLQSMANQLYGMKLVTGSGDILEINQDTHADLMNALAVSVGSAGLLTEATVKMRKAYGLKVETFAEDIKEALSKYQERLMANRHLEMFYFPVGKWSMVKLMNETTDKLSPQGKITKAMDLVLENWLYESLNILASKTQSYKNIDSFMRKFVGYKTFSNWSHRAFPTDRKVRFMEMEYNLPIEKFSEVFEEMQKSIEVNHFQTLFPIEIRFVRGDELWLSPAYQRDSVYFAIHTYIDENYRPYFDQMEKIFKRHGGRPHWGKWHTLTHDDLAERYPRWDDFKKIRQGLDPHGIWLNDHLRSLFIK